jgi:Protein of unknown function (DUF3800)
MAYDYVLYVDEAGDDKVANLKPDAQNGNSEWLCLAGYLVKASDVPELERRRDAVSRSFGGRIGAPIHFRNLKPRNRLKVCEKLSEYSARAFVLCSYKRTMIGHHNERAAAATGNHNYLFNFVVRLLLERVTVFVKAHAAQNGVKNPVLRIEMANRKGHHFGHLKAYVLQLIRQSEAGTTFLATRVIDGSVLRYNEIDRAAASDVPGLQLADIVVSAVFQAIETRATGYAPLPAKKLKGIFAGKQNFPRAAFRRSNIGMTFYPASEAIHLIRNEQAAFFEEFGYDLNWLRSRKSTL